MGEQHEASAPEATKSDLEEGNGQLEDWENEGRGLQTALVYFKAWPDVIAREVR